MELNIEKDTVLYIGGFELPDKNAAAQRVIGIAKGCRELGYEVVFLNSVKNLNTDKAEEKTYFGFKCYEYPRESEFDYLISAKTALRYMARIKPKYVIAYNYPGIALERVRNYCKKHKIKCIADATEWYQAVTGNMIFRLIKTIDTTYRMKSVQCKLDGVIAISRFLFDYYRSCTYTVMIPPTVDIKDEKWSVEKEKDANSITFIYAGSPSMQKERLELIVKAIDGVVSDKRIKLNIVGITEEQFITIYTYESSISPRVKFWGRLNHNTVIEMTKASDWTIIIRDNNFVVNAGFPTKLVESISCGTPVIINRFSNVDDYVKSNEGIIVDVNNIKTELQEKCDEILKPNNLLFDYHNYLDELKSILEG